MSIVINRFVFHIQVSKVGGHIMALDLSRLTRAVNKYLNSISDISAASKKASEEIAEKTRFASELKDAIAQNIQSKTRDVAQVPDFAEQVQAAVKQATSGIESEIQQINGSFEAIREAGMASVEKSSGSKGSGGETSNHDAYSGALSTEALQELSKSQYFSANLLQGSLFDALDANEEGAAGTTSSNSSNAAKSAFDTLSLSDLNMDSLLKSAGLTTGATNLASTLLSDAVEAEAAGTTGTAKAAENSSSDLAKALIKAYSSSAASSAATSIFGDFTL